jgi:hypothetical protein
MNMVMNALLNTIFHPDVYVVVVCPSKKRVFLLNRNYGIINEHVDIDCATEDLIKRQAVDQWYGWKPSAQALPHWANDLPSEKLNAYWLF